jgi:hypothetical protein
MTTFDCRTKMGNLISVVDAVKEMPEYLFSKKFEHHLFFDIDIGTSDRLIRGLQEVVLSGVGPLLTSVVFSSKTRENMGTLELSEDWPKKMTSITESMHERGNYYGLAIVDSSLRWVAYQSDPVSLGVFAFDGKYPWRSVSQDTRDCFVNRKRIEDLLISESREDADSVNWYGRDYLYYLMKNYV